MDNIKTFKKVYEKPRLVIEHDSYASSPRSWSNLGYFVTIDKHYSSPDDNDVIEDIVKSTGQVATDLDDHICLIKEQVEEQLEEQVLAIFPITKYEHSGVSYSLGYKTGFDYSNNGFYIVTKESAKDTGTKRKDFEKVIKDELNIYNQYCSGEVYSYILYDEQGEFEDSCGGFYDIEDIRERLPKEWSKEDLTQYLKYE